MRVVVTGGRDLKNAAWVFGALDGVHAILGITRLAQGGQVSVRRDEHGKIVERWGADYLAKRWAMSRGIPWVEYEADWRTHKKKAGPIRNGEMLRAEMPDRVIALPGGDGTADCVAQARRFGLSVLEVHGRI